MYRKITAIIVTLAMAMCFSGIVSASSHMKTITGTLVSEGQLKADDGQKYMIEDPGAAQNLDQMINKKVEIKGTVKEKEGNKVLQIDSIKQVE